MIKKILALVLLLAGIGHADVIKVTVNVQSATWINGIRVVTALYGASVNVCSSPSTGVPCTNLASVYSDKLKTLPITQPLISNKDGVITFYVDNGSYQYTVIPKGSTVAEGPYELGTAGPPGPQGEPGAGGASYPGVTSDGANGLNIVGSVQTGDAAIAATGFLILTDASGTHSVTLTAPGTIVSTYTLSFPVSVEGDSDIIATKKYVDGLAVAAHTQAISTVTGLQAALDAKAPLSQPVDVGVAYNGKPGASLVLVRHKFPFAWSISTNCADSALFSEVAATASAVFSLTKNGTQFGTATFAIGGTTATFSCTATSGTTADIVKVIAPSSQDATLADLGGTIAGTR